MSVGYACMGWNIHEIFKMTNCMFLGPIAIIKLWPVAFFISIVEALWLVTVGFFCLPLIYILKSKYTYILVPANTCICLPLLIKLLLPFWILHVQWVIGLSDFYLGQKINNKQFGGRILSFSSWFQGFGTLAGCQRPWPNCSYWVPIPFPQWLLINSVYIIL